MGVVLFSVHIKQPSWQASPLNSLVDKPLLWFALLFWINVNKSRSNWRRGLSIMVQKEGSRYSGIVGSLYSLVLCVQSMHNTRTVWFLYLTCVLTSSPSTSTGHTDTSRTQRNLTGTSLSQLLVSARKGKQLSCDLHTLIMWPSPSTHSSCDFHILIM